MGNARVTYTPTYNCLSNTNTYAISNATDYYPYGKILRSYAGSGLNLYGYQSSERETELGDDDYYTHFRGLDGDIARWKQIDPKWNQSWGPYTSMNCNPVMFNDVLGDKVGYGGLKERIQVGFARLASKNFNAVFKDLKSKEDTYTFNNRNGQKTIANGDIKLTSPGQYSIEYKTGKSVEESTPGQGQSPLHVLFEETKHASDFANNRYNPIIQNYQGGSYTSFMDNQSGEASGWKFAADNAPFRPNTATVSRTLGGQTSSATIYNPLAKQISQTNDMNVIKQLLFQTYDLQSNEKWGGGKKYSPYNPILQSNPNAIPPQ